MAGQPQTRAQQQGQQAQALQATRASHQATAAAARRTAALQNPTLPVSALAAISWSVSVAASCPASDDQRELASSLTHTLFQLDCVMLCLQAQQQQQGAAYLLRSVRVLKAATNSNNKGAASSGGEANSGGEGEQQKGFTAPTTPRKKAIKAIPSSPTSSGSSNDPKFCHCCYTMGKPYLCSLADQSSAGLPCLGQYLRLAKTPPLQAFNTLLQPPEFKTGSVKVHDTCSMH